MRQNGVLRQSQAATRILVRRWNVQPRRGFVSSPWLRSDGTQLSTGRGADYHDRIKSLKDSYGLKDVYPGINAVIGGTSVSSLRTILRQYEGKIEPGSTVADHLVRIIGRVKARRTAGSRLVFFDVESTDGAGPPSSLQILCNQRLIRKGHVDASSSEKNIKDSSVAGETIPVTEGEFRTACQTIRVGDWVSFKGNPSRTKSDQLSLTAMELPCICAPMLYQQPANAVDAEKINRRSHLKLLMSQRPRDILTLRMLIEDRLTSSLQELNMVRVRTPIIGASSGGATADTFSTQANALSGEQVTLRIAPELYLKRLVVGAATGVFEIGQAFRNEGIDATHNPEFTICEYYLPFANLEQMMKHTELMLLSMSEKVEVWRQTTRADIKPPGDIFRAAYERKRFLPTLTSEIRAALQDPDFSLPNLEEASAATTLQNLFKRMNISVPTDPMVPRLLDSLSNLFIERKCTSPTWITHQPACLAPLAKSLIDDETGQLVSARAELFIEGKEYVNCYEEENSPFEQRRKFLAQRVRHHSELTEDGGAHRPNLDNSEPKGLSGFEESYIEALEWGLPPTGGWGCGVDRLVMLFAGTDRIADVLPFGTLQNVAAMGKPWRA